MFESRCVTSVLPFSSPQSLVWCQPAWGHWMSATTLSSLRRASGLPPSRITLLHSSSLHRNPCTSSPSLLHRHSSTSHPGRSRKSPSCVCGERGANIMDSCFLSSRAPMTDPSAVPFMCVSVCLHCLQCMVGCWLQRPC